MKRIVPRLVALDHGVEDAQELAHACQQGHFLGFACDQQALIERLYDRVVPGGHERCHVQRRAQRGASAADAAFALEAA